MSISNHIPVLQVLIPLFAALLCILTFNKFISWFISIITSILNLTIGFYNLFKINNYQSYCLGNWLAPIGVEYKLDYLNQPIIIYINAVLLFFLIFGQSIIDATVIKYIEAKKQHMFYSLLLFAHTGYLGILSSNDLFNSYIFIEMSSLATCVLLSIGKRSSALIGAFNYLIVCTIGAILILISIGFIFSMTGSLNIFDISSILQVNYNQNRDLSLLLVAVTFFIAGNFLKMALFPLHSWIVSAYYNSASCILSYLAGISSLVGIYMLTRFLYFTIKIQLISIPLLLTTRIIANIAIISCSYLALRANNIKKIIIFSTLVNVGYSFILFSVDTAKTLLFQFLFIDSISKIALFSFLSYIENKTSILDIDFMPQIRNSSRFKVLVAFIILFNSSLPLTSMFITKIMILEMLIKKQLLSQFFIIVLSTGAGVLYHLKILKAIFFSQEENRSLEINTNLLGLYAIIIVHVLTLLYMNEILKITDYYNSIL